MILASGFSVMMAPVAGIQVSAVLVRRCSTPVAPSCGQGGSHYMPSSAETNNTSDYAALLLRVRTAADNGLKKLRVKGDSTLVIRQVCGIFATRRTRLRRLWDAVKGEVA
ncbi:unnamed protein product [Peronospora belbahrii]|uniref:RNase H type-1 domain-containing protein n=1 Tax=Peronospora belbahrii TaxID=622444 RepID=A0AAU9KSB7_9STRA|nr:unnamed protein product [Peronospora belbahrii]CAH0476222.1 unnamed protein product [Peronospora belbahrii]CAH0476225.1 unnamed protein product [Peronospora belbahrii]